MKPLLRRLASWFPPFDPEVDHALFLTGHHNLTSTAIGQMLLTGLVALTAYRRTDAWVLWPWVGYLLLIGVCYLLLRQHFQPELQQPPPNVVGVKRWYRYRRALQACSAVGWGGLAWLMVPDATIQNATLMIVFTGVIGHAAAGNSANDFLGSVTSAVIGLLVFLWQLPSAFGPDALPLMAMLVLYVVVLISSLGNTHRSLRQSIRLQVDNKALAASNAAQARRAEQANRDKSEFLAAASHDLRQPVHALLLLIEAYRQQVPQAMHHPVLIKITQAGQTINSLFSALMELSRLESGTEKPNLAEVALCSKLPTWLERYRPEADAKGLSLRCFLAPRVEASVVSTDPVLLGRVVSNLLSNALHYTSGGGVLLSLRPAHAGQGLWLEVWDTGVGMTQKDMARIFDPYVQLGNRERDRSKGLGLGLAIVKHACELLGLTVSVQSVPRRGSCFRVTLAARLITTDRVRTDVGPVRAASQLPALPRQPWLMGRRVLLVEDDPLVVAAMQALLAGWGLDLRCTARGDVSVLDACPPGWAPECVLSDYRLPGPLNGLAVLDLLQQRFPRVMTVLLTGEMASSVQQEAEDAGYLLLSKPVDAGVLAHTLGMLLERRSEERSA